MNEIIIRELEEKTSLEKALRYLEKKRFPLHLMEVIAQDEFSHDVVIPFLGEGSFLTLGVT